MSAGRASRCELQIDSARLPRLGLVVEANLLHRDDAAKGLVNVLHRKPRGVVEQEPVDQIVGEVGDIVLGDPVADQTEFFEVNVLGDVCLIESLEKYSEVLVQFTGEFGTKTAAMVAGCRIPPVLLDFRKAIPGGDEAIVKSLGLRLVVEKLEVPDDLPMEFPYTRCGC